MGDLRKTCDIVKVDDELGLVFGFGIVCKRAGEDYYDTQGDTIDEGGMLGAATEFALNSSISTDMHAREDGKPVQDGDVVFMFPLTSDIAKSLNIVTQDTGLLIAMKPSPEVLAKFKDGTYTGFSIGGSRVEEEVVEE